MRGYKNRNKIGSQTLKKEYNTGAFYTPMELGLRMVKYLNITQESKILDPCVGRANLFKAIKQLYPDIPNDNFYGCDIDQIAIEENLKDPDLEGMHFQVGDCLVDDLLSDIFWGKPPLKLRSCLIEQCTN
jgi:hypothetical protein